MHFTPHHISLFYGVEVAILTIFQTIYLKISTEVDNDDLVGKSLLRSLKLRNGHKAKLLFRLWAQGLVKILKLKFRQNLKLEFGRYFVADVL